MAHLHDVFDDDLCFSIDAGTREITHLSEDPIIICRTDHNSERFTFEIPREIEGHDMLLCDKVEVHYINIYSDRSTQRNVGMYKITDLQIAEDDDSILLCSWVLSQNATMYTGTLNFALRFACTVGSKIDYVWVTKVYSGVQVEETIDNTDIVLDQYTDILENWYAELMMSGTLGVNVVDEAKTQALEAIAAAEEETVNRIKEIDVIVEVENEVLERIRAAAEEAEAIILENEREKLITDMIARLPVYNGEQTENPRIQFWIEATVGEYAVYGPFTAFDGMTWSEFIADKLYESASTDEFTMEFSHEGYGSMIWFGARNRDGVIISEGVLYTEKQLEVFPTSVIIAGETYFAST